MRSSSLPFTLLEPNVPHLWPEKYCRPSRACHVDPVGARHLLNASPERKAFLVDLTWVELVNHASSAWKYLTTAISTFTLTELPASLIAPVVLTRDAWVQADQMLGLGIANPIRTSI
jgi:hypothetical protein